MSSQSDLLLIGVVAVVGYFAYQAFAGKGGVLEQTKDTGAAFGQWLNLSATTSRAAFEGYSAPIVPDTPEGFLRSNWTWTLPDGTKLGLPAGMTPGEFCAESPTSPICEQIKVGG